MKGKILILLVMFVFLLASGCAEEDNTSVPDDSDIPVPEADEDAQPEESASLKSGKEHIIRLENYGVIRPAELNISKGDTISWRSDKKQGNYVLVSEDGLFPDEKLSYKVSFTYTFNEAGTYSFIVKDIPEMNATIRVN
ncbi:cell surface lipoprotein [Methanosarcina sp. MSH10X1]|uniref:cell surface lipoprotein n=1 Tax=Methanosarcina sp. MSH10X1 TaxID=2507075 RepID=UPI000FFB2AF1|nr:cell surface lipoprotein [Methanosarcina sp. MSH10X1]RXA18007.1 cell surface lipoprotein [Methanosarcina sp. MSH10X1]